MTTQPRIHKTEAIVLKHLPLGEADYLLTLYTPNQGRLRATARGARKVKSRLGGHLEPLMRTSLLMVRGQSMDTVQQAEVLEGFRAVREDLDRLSQAIYMAELVDAATPEGQSNYPVYRLLLEAMRSLAGRAAPALLPHFQLRLLGHSGFMPELQRCVECEAVLEPERHRFAPGRGGCICDSCHPPGVSVLPLSLNTLKALRFLQRCERFDDTERLRLDDDTLSEMRRLLDSLIQYVLDREPRGSRFLGQVSQSRTRDGAGARDVNAAGEDRS